MKTILVVDDRMEVREIVKVTLSIEDFSIVEATNGEDAVHLARMHVPDLIIMDLMMPGKIDGLQATEIIKKNDALKKCKIIVLTARNQEKDKEAIFKAGADDYFTKPFSPLELLKKVDEILDS